MDLFKDTYGNRKKKTTQKSHKPTAKQVRRNKKISMPLIKQTKKSRKCQERQKKLYKQASHRSRSSSQASYYKTAETS